MAAVTPSNAFCDVSSTNNAAISSATFTPAANDLIVAIAVVTGQTNGGTFTDTQGLGWATIITAKKNTSADCLIIAVSNDFATASSLAVTFTPAGSPTSSGDAIAVLRVSGMTRKGSQAVRQSAKQENQISASNNTPVITFGSNCLINNPTILGFANASNPATQTEPSGWTEHFDDGYSTPDTGIEVASRDSGFSSTTITWGNTSLSNFCCAGIELDISNPPEFISKAKHLSLNFVPRQGNLIPYRKS